MVLRSPHGSAGDSQAVLTWYRSSHPGRFRSNGQNLPQRFPRGSHAVLCRVEQAQAGDVVLAVLGDQCEPVLRNLVREGSSLMLVADDARYPTYPLNDSVRVVARVSEVIQRRLV